MGERSPQQIRFAPSIPYRPRVGASTFQFKHRRGRPRRTPDPLVEPTRHRAEFSFLLDGSFFQTAEHFRDAPGLRDTTARGERRLGVKDFADRTDTGFSEMRLKTAEMPRCCMIIGVNPEPSIDERADQPSPPCPVMAASRARRPPK
jgi:hypothetical protein